MLDLEGHHYVAIGCDVAAADDDGVAKHVVFSATRMQPIAESVRDARMLAHMLNNYRPLMLAAKAHHKAFADFMREVDWGKSALTAQTIMRANETPVFLDNALKAADLDSAMTPPERG